MLATQRLGARPVFAVGAAEVHACPYQFLLSAIYRLQPNEEPEPLQRLDPLTRGSLFHEVQARVLPRAARRRPAAADDGRGRRRRWRCSSGVLAEVAAKYEEQLAPAIERVWRDEIAAIGRDLRVWVRKLPEARRLDADAFRVQLRPVRRGTRRAQRRRAGHDRRPLHPARLGRPDRVAGRVRGAAHHRSQDRPEPHDAADGDRRRRRRCSRCSTASRSSSCSAGR